MESEVVCFEGVTCLRPVT